MKKPETQEEMKVNVLGTIYIVEIKKQEEMKRLAEDSSFIYGLCKYGDKKIYIDVDVAQDENEFRTTLRHELIHAFAYESGCFTQVEFALDEMCIDWFALQFPKIFEAFNELNIL